MDANHTTDPPAYLLEVAWEVCTQIGGIYTVLRSKTPAMLKQWQDRYLLIGPYDAERTDAEFERIETNGLIGEVIEALAAEGIQCHYGRWLITGYPRVLLIDWRAAADRLTDLKYRLWMDHDINIPPDDGLSHDVLLFAALVSRLFEVLASRLPARTRVVGHFHEWMTGLTIPILKKRGLPIATVFTTHATVVGRAVCGDRDDFYDVLGTLNPDVESGRRQIYHRYCIERAAAASADVFTTVSDVTADESAQLLCRRPDLITPNGLRVQKFEALHEFQNLHRRYKERLNQFVMGHFFGSYVFDLDKTIYVFLAGRYEYHNKGMDVYLEALARLNQTLRENNSDVTVVAFVITRTAVRGMNRDVLHARFTFEELRRYCEYLETRMGERILSIAATGRLPEAHELLDADAVVRLKRIQQARHRSGLPIVVTHDLCDDAHDAVLCHIRYLGLFNAETDRVKIVYHPDFVTPTSPLFHMDYEQFVRGCHLGIFPSYYEPWGYTPAECTAMGVPSVTSDLSGFGSFVQTNIPDHDAAGLYVLPRRHKPIETTIQHLTEVLVDFCQLNRRQRIEMRNRVESLSDLLAWRRLAAHYFEAQELALQRSRAAEAKPSWA
ncbi:MAG: glycogen/starch synthase [Phycisphaerae bacterium]|nr:glycogen/starch synthase [Phycisphaerae bacterium]